MSEAADAYDVCTRDAAGNFIDLLEGFDDGDNSVERHWLHARHTLIKGGTAFCTFACRRRLPTGAVWTSINRDFFRITGSFSQVSGI